MSTEISPGEKDQVDGPPLPVHLAVMNNDLEKLQKLIQSGAPQLNPKTYETALHVAARAPSLQCLQWLLDNYINSPRDCDCNGSTPCHYAVVYGNQEALQILLNHDPKNKEELSEMKGENGLTILGLATLQGDLSTVKWIVDNFPGLAYLKDKSGNLPIHLAAAGGALDIVMFFVERYGREYAEQMGSEKKFQPVYYAVDKGRIDVVKYLIDEVKVNPLAKAKGGMTTLHAAVTAHQVSITKWLIEKLGPRKILEKSDDGATLLHLAAAEGLPELLQFLIDKLPDKSDINVSDDLGSTAAHDAAEFGEHDTLMVLLKNGADISLLNENGETPFDLAVQNNHNDLIAMMADFREKGVKGLNKHNEPENNQIAVNNVGGPSRPVRTSKDEAEEITDLIQQTTDIVVKRKEEEDHRQQSLQRLSDDDHDESGEDLEKELMKNRENGRVSRSKFRSSTDEIPHEIGPEGNIYAKVNKIRKPKEIEKEDHMSDVGSHVSSHRVSRLHNSSGNHNYNDSTSSVGTSVSRSKKFEQFHGPPRMLGYYPPPSFPHPYYKKAPRSISGSSVGSGSNVHYPHSLPGYLSPGYPPSHGYPYMPAMVAQYYGYPYPPQAYPYHPLTKGINERIHMEALQKSGGQSFLPFPGNYSLPRPGYYHGGKKPSRPSSGQPNQHKKSSKTKKKQNYKEMGFGPAGLNENAGIEDVDEDHPAPPPITKGGRIDHNPTELMHANFIMIKTDEEGKIPTQASEGTKLQRARIPKKYDGRYDDYIETDSEDERQLPEHISISTLAESALSLMMVPLLGVKGVDRLRPKEQKMPPKAYDEIEAQKTSKQWSSQQDLAEKFNKKEGSAKSNVQPSDVSDWSEMLGVSLAPSKTTQVISGLDISGSIRARNFAIQELQVPLIHQSMASLHNDEDNDDDIVSVVIGEDPQEWKEKPVKHSSSSSTHKKEKQRSAKSKSDKQQEMTDGKSGKSKKKSKSSSRSKSESKSSSRSKSESKTSSRSKSESKSKEKSKEKKTSEEKKEQRRAKKQKNMTVIPSSSNEASVETKEPVIIKNTAVLEFDDDSDEGGKKMYSKSMGTSQGSVDVEDIFAETEKEIEQMLAGMPQSPTVESIATEYENTESNEQEREQLNQLQNMFPQTSHNGMEQLSTIIDAIKGKGEEITHQQKIRLQLIQDVLAEKDPELIAKLLSLISEGWSPMSDHMESASNTQLIADIENKLLESQERQRQETEEHFRTQSETLERRLKEQADRNMETIQQRFDQQNKLMMEQLEEQRKLLEQERKAKRSKYTATSDDDDSDEETMVRATPQSVIVNKTRGRTSTMEAKLKHQKPLKWEDFSKSDDSIPSPPPIPSIKYLLAAVDDPVLKKQNHIDRRETMLVYNETSKAFRKFNDEDSEDDDDDDDDELMQAKPKMATRKRADILKIQENQQKRSLETFTQQVSGKGIKNVLTVP